MIPPPAWQRWDWHPSVVIGLALLGGLYVYLGGLAAPRWRGLAFGAALVVLGVALLITGVYGWAFEPFEV